MVQIAFRQSFCNGTDYPAGIKTALATWLKLSLHHLSQFAETRLLLNAFRPVFNAVAGQAKFMKQSRQITNGQTIHLRHSCHSRLLQPSVRPFDFRLRILKRTNAALRKPWAP